MVRLQKGRKFSVFKPCRPNLGPILVSAQWAQEALIPGDKAAEM